MNFFIVVWVSLFSIVMMYCLIALGTNARAGRWHMIYTIAAYELAIWMLEDDKILYDKYGCNIQKDINDCLVSRDHLACNPKYWITYLNLYSIFKPTKDYEWLHDVFFMEVLWDKVTEAAVAVKRRGHE